MASDCSAYCLYHRVPRGLHSGLLQANMCHKENIHHDICQTAPKREMDSSTRGFVDHSADPSPDPSSSCPCQCSSANAPACPADSPGRDPSVIHRNPHQQHLIQFTIILLLIQIFCPETQSQTFFKIQSFTLSAKQSNIASNFHQPFFSFIDLLFLKLAQFLPLNPNVYKN